ncbi:hypothetical protein PA7_43520 [Pseudonocardia asaccharolytica DSM 44247 = NBRC 16224]|uniref:DUF6398 domain-containing protein n=1 Tax=Pseudonocardia asaccharolytica DSM 44247 = NBRC 16224 TaxID=1123024 RepID=A0A511D6U3_9PSEU|nr:hypothetical protein PA7_43520 [Pseudonocardia asaccharolytica DSM 44247 = NBRC 16224]
MRPAEPDLLGDVAAALADDHPLALLGLVSTLLAAIEPRPGPFEPPAGPDLPSREELVATFLEVDLPETSALLAALAELLGEDVLRRRVRRELASRGHALPRWLVELDRAETVGEAVGVGHVLGDGDDIMFGVRLSGGRELSVAVYVDHNLGTVAKDAFVVPEPLPGLVEQMLATIDDPDTTAGELDRADAGVRITEAIDRGKITFPPFETDTWPGCRPLVEWAVRLLPTGGTGYRRPEWDDDALAALTERFLASPFGAEFDDADHRGLLESLLWFGTDYGPGDPLRWSPVAVEILLADWIPRKIVADAPYLAKAPALLRAFIRFCHHERGIRPALTALTLAAVDEHEPGYRRTIRSPRPQGPAALLAAMGALDPDGPWPPLDAEPPGLPEIMLDALRRAVGSESALDALDASPLPDESFDWRSIPADIHDRVAEVLALVDRGSGELLDVESRTACRRLLARAAAGDPEIFRRRGRAATAAAAICWIIGKANRSVGADGVAVKDLTGHFGLGRSTVSPRSKPLLRAIGVAPEQYGGMDLASPDYLTAARRGQIIADRDRYRAMRDPR